MKKFLVLGLVMTMFGAGLVYAQQDSVGTIIKVGGAVNVLPEGKDVEAAAEGKLLYEGDTIKSEDDGYAVINMSNGTELKVASNTKFIVEKSKTAATLGSSVWVQLGRIKAKVLKTGGRSVKFKVRTPVAVASIRGSEVDVNVGEDTKTDVAIVEGDIDVTNNFGTISAGDMVLDCRQGAAANITFSPEEKKVAVAIPPEVKGAMTVKVAEQTVSMTAGSQITMTDDPTTKSVKMQVSEESKGKIEVKVSADITVKLDKGNAVQMKANVETQKPEIKVAEENKGTVSVQMGKDSTVKLDSGDTINIKVDVNVKTMVPEVTSGQVSITTPKGTQEVSQGQEVAPITYIAVPATPTPAQEQPKPTTTATTEKEPTPEPTPTPTPEPQPIEPPTGDVITPVKP